jgi:UDP-N-acetyl-D-mannosaminuronic acid dehydrogenase
MKKISIVGLGYIGLPTALVAANSNLIAHSLIVNGFDIDKSKIKSINNGICPIQEPGMQELLSQVLETGRFKASCKLESADCFVIAVPTPFTENKEPDLQYVLQVTKVISKQLKKNNTIILESTVPVGTTQKLAQLIKKESGLQAGTDFFLAYCPERVLPGKIIHEIIHNDRVIGGVTTQSAERAREFYKKFVTGTCYMTDDKTAEMVKLVENSTRDIEIALANQIAQMCEASQINPFNVINLANKHPRINLLQPGCGVGGHCIAVDPWFLIKSFQKETSLLQAARDINDQRPYEIIKLVVSRARKFVKEEKRKPKVLALGLTFKPNTDDTRQSPALLITQELGKRENMLELEVYDPLVKSSLRRGFGGQDAGKENKNLIEKFMQADIILTLVKHAFFEQKLSPHELDFHNISLHNKIVIDTCGLFQGKSYEATFFRKGKSKVARSSNTTN